MFKQKTIFDFPDKDKEEKILHLLREERMFYIDILDLEKKENTCLVNEPVLMDRFRHLQASKRRIISQIQNLEISLEPLKQYWKDKKDRSGKTSVQINEELNILDHLLKSILYIDELNQTLMEEKIKLYYLKH